MSKGAILLVEDHRDLADTILFSLENAGYICDYAGDGVQALELATTQVFDVIVLDIMLPGIDGMGVCSRLRNDYGIDTPVLMLTARDELSDRLEGFERGSDDYLVKPFEMAELIARVAALVNRKRGKVAKYKITSGDLDIDLRTRTVTRAGTQIVLSPTGFKILRILVREAPSIVSRTALEQELWGDEIPDSDALRSHVYMLRKALDKPFESDGNTMIRTKKGIGFMIDLQDTRARKP
jgi:DNA-binding response OmpR family regulator